MSLFEKIFNILAALVFLSAGIVIICASVYNCFFVPLIPKSKGWQKTRGRVVGKKDYKVKAMPSKYDYRSGPKYISGTEKLIVYTVNGKEYKKAVPDDHKEPAHIYYKKSNPNYFRTVHELKHWKHNWGAGVFIAALILGAFFLGIGIWSLSDLIQEFIK